MSFIELRKNPSIPPIHLTELRRKSPLVLLELIEELHIKGLVRPHKKDIISALLKEYARRGEDILGDGVLEILPDGFGFLRSPEASYLAGSDDIYISPSQIRRFYLQTGDTVSGKIRPPKESERYFALSEVISINFDPCNAADFHTIKSKVLFENLTPIYPRERLLLERGDGSPGDITTRVIDLLVPIGKGQRGLIVAPPKVGKTMMLRNIAQSITHNHKECFVIVLLVGERPEEVTDMRRSVEGEVVASTFDEPATRHIQVAEMVIEKAKRLVEHKHDVVVLLDSITRLARAYNIVMPSSGKVLTGGIDASVLHPLKRFFGAARNVEEPGSLTTLATILKDTGSAGSLGSTVSKMDDMLCDELKGTGNMDIYLDRLAAEKGIFPPIKHCSGTRREDLFMTEEDLQKRWILRRILRSMDDASAIEFLVDRLRKTTGNEKFFEAMKQK